MLIFRKKPVARVKIVPYIPPPMVERIYTGDLFDVLPTLDSNLLDACVTDPPYGLEFMGKDWDKLDGAKPPGYTETPRFKREREGSSYPQRNERPNFYIAGSRAQKWHELWAEEVWRVLKPGGYLVAFGGTRTFHRLTCALEDAGFEIRDCLSWMYGTGFPKSLDVSKAIDNMLMCGKSDPMSMWDGTRRTRTFDENGRRYTMPGQQIGNNVKAGQEILTHPEAETWRGWGTALKPGWEPIILARKPLRGTVAENVLKFGTGAMNIDACRIDFAGETDRASAFPGGKLTSHGTGKLAGPGSAQDAERSGFSAEQSAKGRWPANVLFDEAAALQLDAQTGLNHGASAPVRGTEPSVPAKNVYGVYGRVPGAFYGDTGGASRFFYCAKPSRSERDLGCEDLPDATGGEATDRVDDTDGLNSPRAGAGRTGGSKNIHPTVKPLKVMQWLVKLVTPPGGIVLDPFLGSGTTAMACVKEGFGYIGIEREETYAEIAKRRVESIRNLMLDKP